MSSTAARLRLEITAFGAVGALAFLIDNGGYNLLVFGVPGHSPGPMAGAPVAASVVATGVATVFSWAGNRWWTYRHQRRARASHEFLLFVVVNIIGMGITAAAVFVARWAGFDSLLSDNIARLVGWTLATVFRFFTYRSVVFVSS